MKIILATLELTATSYGHGKETKTHFLIDTSFEKIVDKIDSYTHEELDIETKNKIMYDINICRTSKWESEEWMESFVLKIQDNCEL